MQRSHVNVERLNEIVVLMIKHLNSAMLVLRLKTNPLNMINMEISFANVKPAKKAKEPDLSTKATKNYVITAI